MSYTSIGKFTIDTGYNEPEWANPQSWAYEAKVEPKNSYHAPVRPLNTALYNLMCTAEVARARTFFQAGSTSGPSNLGDRRIIIIVEVWVAFVEPIANYTGIGLDTVDWQLIRIN